MKNKEELSKTIAELQKQLTIAQEQIKKYEENINKRWRADNDCRYFYIDSFGTVYDRVDERYSADNYRYKTGNYFATREGAEEYKERLIAEQELLDMCDDVSWRAYRRAVNKFSIWYNHDYKRFEYIPWAISQYSKYNFRTIEKASKAIETLGEEKLKLIFGVK